MKHLLQTIVTGGGPPEGMEKLGREIDRERETLRLRS